MADHGLPGGTGGTGDAADARTDDAVTGGGTRGGGRGGGLQLSDLMRYVAAGALLAAGVVHFAYAPGHLDESGSHGVFFLAVGWLQIALAGALAFRLRPERPVLAATVVVNAAVVGVWVVSRTVGVPGSDAESVGFPDVLATVCEVVAVLGALAALSLLAGRGADRVLPGRPALGLGGIGALATVVLVSMSVTPSIAGEHDHGHDDGANGTAHADGHGGHGGGHMNGASAAGGEDFARARLAALEGYLPDAQLDQFRELAGENLAQELRNRSELLRGLPEAEREERIDAYVAWTLDRTLSLLDGAQANGEEMHSHGPTEWQPIDDPDDLVALQEQLSAAGEVIDRYPTVADAEAAGYYQISPYVPGIAAHWINGGLLDGEFDPAEPEMLLFNGTQPDSELVGLSYASVGDEAPDGFVGPNDEWHAHTGLCMTGGLVVGIDGTPEELCESVGGNIARQLGNLWMAHLWQVPGWESPWGLFSAENPNINVATSDMWTDRAS
jgi:hypothetical protein